MREAVERLRWDRFSRRFEEDGFGSVDVTDMSVDKYGTEQCASYSSYFRRIIQKRCDENEDSDEDSDDGYMYESDNEKKTLVKIKRILTFQSKKNSNSSGSNSNGGSNCSTFGTSRRRSERERENRMSGGGSTNEVSLPASNLKAVGDLLVAIMNNHQTKSKFLSNSSNSGSGTSTSSQSKSMRLCNTTRAIAHNTNELPLFPASLILSSKTVSWTLLGGVGVTRDVRFSQSTATLPPVGSRVYYCIEEREYYKKIR